MLSRQVTSPRGASLLACLLFLAVAGQFYAFTPILEGPDSVAHFRYVRYIAVGRGLPVAQQESAKGEGPGAEGAQSILYYAVGAALSFWIPMDDFSNVVVLNPSGSLGDTSSDGNKNIVLHKPVAGFPRGTELAARILGLFSLLCGLATVVCAVWIARVCRPRQPLAWLASGAAVAAVPAFAFHSTVVTNDNLVTALASLTVLCLVMWVKSQRELFSWLSAIALSLAVLTKFNAVVLMLAFGVAAWNVRALLPQRLLELGKLLLVMGIVDVWWLVHSQMANGDFTGMVAANRALNGNDYQFKLDPARLEVAWHNMAASLHSFVAIFGATNIAPPEPFFLVPAGLGAIGLAAGAWVILRAPKWPEAKVVLTWALAAVAEVATHNLIGPGNGRYLFPAIASLAVVVAVGWGGLLSAIRLPRAGWLIALGAVGLSAAVPLLVVRPAYERPPILRSLPSSAQPTNVTFDNAVELAGFDAPAAPVQPDHVYAITLYWRLLGQGANQLSNFVHVESSDSAYAPRAGYEGVIGHGSYPPNFWQPGEIVVDRYHLRLGPDTRAGNGTPVTLSVRVGMYKAAPDQPVEKVPTTPAEVKDVGFVVARWQLAAP